MSPFRKVVQVIRRSRGRYDRGIWLNADDPPPEPMLLGIQPAKADDYERLQSLPSGRQFMALKRAYADLDSAPLVPAGLGEGEPELPGDLVLHEGARWLVIGRHTRDQFGSIGVSHVRYLIAREIQTGFAEVTT